MKKVILGAQWGDEGKGKIVDLLSKDFDIVVRYQGGNNAGHTVVIENNKFILHILPTGLLHKHTVGIISQGMVIDIDVLLEEIESIEVKGINIKDRLFISDRAHIILPYHKKLDALFEKQNSIGTTLKGIGPTYMFKYARKGIRIIDLLDEKLFYDRLTENMSLIKSFCEVYKESFDFDINEIYETTLKKISSLKDNIKPVAYILKDSSKNILFEGAQGVMLDIDIGTYPYVTSSNASVLGLCNGNSLSPKFFCDSSFVGVSKAYVTRVGAGPFPTELLDETGELLRDKGKEYGSTTGRPRRCGWLDLVALKYACFTNDISELIITKLDVLDNFETVKICIAYEIDGEKTDRFPSSLEALNKAKPVYEMVKGWNDSTASLKDKNKLPKNALSYIKFIQDYLNVKVVMLSTGPKREDFIILD